MNAYVMLLDLGLSFGKTFLEKLKNKAPADVLSAGQAFIDAVETHRADVLSKENFEKQRG